MGIVSLKGHLEFTVKGWTGKFHTVPDSPVQQAIGYLISGENLSIPEFEIPDTENTDLS